MNKHIPRLREPFSLSEDPYYAYLGNPLLRKAADKVLTKRRDGSSHGKHGVKSPYPTVSPPHPRASNSGGRYVEHQGAKECKRRAKAQKKGVR